MENEDFFIKKQEAVERMRQFARQSQGFDIPAPPFAKKREPPKREPPPRENPPKNKKPSPLGDKKPADPAGFLRGLFSGLDLPFFGREGEGDLSLLLALALLLFDDGCDRLLLYALIYILL